MTTTGSLKELWLEYLAAYQTMSLATSKGGVVDNSSVYFAFNAEGDVFFASDSGTAKVKNLRDNGAYCATMNDGGVSPRGIKTYGKAIELDADAAARANRLLVERIPAIKPFLQRPNVAYFRLQPAKRFLINFAWGVDWRVEVP
jgi:hypothetical protein